MICHCKKGMMSQCEAADSFSDQLCCHFFERATRKTKCMFLTETMNNHCWSPGAQAAAAAFEEIDAVDTDTEELTLEDAIEEELEEMLEDRPRQYCLSCIHYPCSEVKATERKNNVSHLSENELWDLGTMCDNYSDRAAHMATISINAAGKGGNVP